MQEITITKEAASLLQSIYRAYKKRRNKGCKKQEAALFGDPSDIQKEIRSKRSLEDITDACWELYDADLLLGTPGDDKLSLLSLSKLGITYAEGKTAGFLRNVWGLVKDLLPFIP